MQLPGRRKTHNPNQAQQGHKRSTFGQTLRFHVVLLRAGCAVRATLGFRYGYLNAWELY